MTSTTTNTLPRDDELVRAANAGELETVRRLIEAGGRIPTVWMGMGWGRC